MEDAKDSSNELLADAMEEMSIIHKIKGDRIRMLAYAKASQALRVHPERITSGKQATSINGIGAKMAKRLDEILDTGELAELIALKRDPDVMAVRELTSVFGIGPKR